MPSSRDILIVEDEADLRDLISFNLQREGFVCRSVGDGEKALVEIQRRLPDLIVLDRMLPGVSGDDVLTRLRREDRTATLPVIMLTAKADETDELIGFALGADDYIAKPFSMKSLLARVSALLRRSGGDTPLEKKNVLSSGPVTLDAERYIVTVENHPIKLTTTEFRLLRAMMAADGRLRSREQLIDSALGLNVAVVDRTIDVHVAALRKKLGSAARWVQTVRGVGYVWRAPIPQDESSA